jgi:hypothetical protein
MILSGWCEDKVMVCFPSVWLKWFIWMVWFCSLEQGCRSAYFNADPDPDFSFDADLYPDTAPHQCDGNLRPLIYRLFKAHFEPPGLHCERPRPSTALNVNPDPSFYSYAIWIRIQLTITMQTRICNSASEDLFLISLVVVAGMGGFNLDLILVWYGSSMFG